MGPNGMERVGAAIQKHLFSLQTLIQILMAQESRALLFVREAPYLLHMVPRATAKGKQPNQ